MSEFNAARASTTGEFRGLARSAAPDDASSRAVERAIVRGRHLKSVESSPGAINPLFPISARSFLRAVTLQRQ